MPHTMNNKDICRAAAAMMEWFESQDIGAKQAVQILTVSMVELIHELARLRGKNAADDGRFVADCIITALAQHEPRAKP